MISQSKNPHDFGDHLTFQPGITPDCLKGALVHRVSYVFGPAYLWNQVKSPITNKLCLIIFYK